jgi:dihydroorotase-like cyclic amidohydrolase
MDYHIKQVNLVNEGKISTVDVLIRNERIERIDPSFDVPSKPLKLTEKANICFRVL